LSCFYVNNLERAFELAKQVKKWPNVCEIF
jgi:hypothetical protein